jgi:hypothetical protein
MSNEKDSGLFSNMLKSRVEETEDIYDIKNFGDSQKESRLQVKLNRISNTLFGSSGVSGKFIQGAMMGATVGGCAGTVFGLVSFIQHRKVIYIPLVALSMAFSFGFFMGVGTVIRSDDTRVSCDRIVFIHGQTVVLPPAWKEKYRVD